MLVAKRDPFHGAQDAPSNHAGVPPASAPKLTRVIGAIQIVGTLLAIPVGLGSAYSMYRANFAVETTCQSLRANIIATLDKRVDAGARHMLVRRDIQDFERSCGAVDPDATAAFKELLAADQQPIPIPAPAPVVVGRPAESPAQVAAPKAEPRPAVAAKPPVRTAAAPKVEATAAKSDSDVTQHDAQSSDAAWLAAVRSALVSRTAAAPPAVAPLARDSHSLGTLTVKSANAAAPAPLPPLPSATWTASAALPPANADHPVPPAPIPAMTAVTKPPEPRSRLGELVAQIPLLGSIIEP